MCFTKNPQLQRRPRACICRWHPGRLRAVTHTQRHACVLNIIRIDHAKHNNFKWSCQEFNTLVWILNSSIYLHPGSATNRPSYLQSLRIKSSGRLVTILGKSSFSMPLRIKLYVIIWSAPENGGLEKESNTDKWNGWQEQMWPLLNKANIWEYGKPPSPS